MRARNEARSVSGLYPCWGQRKGPTRSQEPNHSPPWHKKFSDICRCVFMVRHADIQTKLTYFMPMWGDLPQWITARRCISVIVTHVTLNESDASRSITWLQFKSLSWSVHYLDIAHFTEITVVWVVRRHYANRLVILASTQCVIHYIPVFKQQR